MNHTILIIGQHVSSTQSETRSITRSKTNPQSPSIPCKRYPTKLAIPKIEINFDTPNRERFLRDEFSQRNSASYTVLGRGSYGVVIKAAYKGQHVAVKIVEKHRKYRCRYDSLRNEANVLNLKHENIVRVLKIISGARYGLVIMERFDGYCLQSVLNRGYEVTVYHRLL